MTYPWSSGEVLTAADLNAALGPTRILQVVSTTKTDTFSVSVASGGNAAITGLTATITPSATSSKILVMAQVSGQRDQSGGSGVMDLSLAPTRGGTVIAGATGDAAGSRSRIHAQNRGGATGVANSVSVLYLDSPSSTSALTYGINVFCGISAGSATIDINRSVADTDAAYFFRSASTITVMEVAG
jgi:hypothetical protein